MRLAVLLMLLALVVGLVGVVLNLPGVIFLGFVIGLAAALRGVVAWR